MDLNSGCAWKGQCRLFHFLWKAGYNRAILLSTLHTVKALAAFHVVQSSASLLSAHGVPVVSQMQHTHICVQQMIQNRLFWSENESSVSAELSASESFFLKYFVLPFPYFPNMCKYMSNTSCAWAEDSRVSQPTSSAAIIHHYVQPVSLPSEQRQAFLGDLRVQSSALNFSCHESWFP